jgi:hypothetical protein
MKTIDDIVASTNRWRRISAELWMCFRWDVCRTWGGNWEVNTPYGRQYRGEFRSAEAAMNFADGVEA